MIAKVVDAAAGGGKLSGLLGELLRSDPGELAMIAKPLAEFLLESELDGGNCLRIRDADEEVEGVI